MTRLDIVRQRLQALRKDARRAATYAAWGGAGAFFGNLVAETAIDFQPSTNSVAVLGNVSVWLALVGAGVTAGLAACAATRGNWRSITFPAVLRPACWGALAGAVSGFVAQVLYFMWDSEVGRVAAWGVGGALLGLVLAPYVPNLTRARASVGGAIGGALGGIAFIALAFSLGAVFGRFAGVAIVGAAIGAMVVFADAVLRAAWIEARYDTGHLETRTLGEAWVIVGSDERNASIYALNAPLAGLRYRLAGNAVACEDNGSGFRGSVKSGDRRRTGNVEVVVRSATEEATVAPAPKPSNSLPDPPAKPASAPAPAPGGAPARPAANARTFTAYVRRDRVVVGSANACEILVQAPGVSATHVEVLRGAGTCRVAPIGGAAVHVSPIGDETGLRPISSATEMRDGMLIAFGPARAVFRDAPARLEITV